MGVNNIKQVLLCCPTAQLAYNDFDRDLPEPPTEYGNRVVLAFDWASNVCFPLYGGVPYVEDDVDRAAAAAPKLMNLFKQLAQVNRFFIIMIQVCC